MVVTCPRKGLSLGAGADQPEHLREAAGRGSVFQTQTRFLSFKSVSFLFFFLFDGSAKSPSFPTSPCRP